jgi:hypothetical protein
MVSSFNFILLTIRTHWASLIGRTWHGILRQKLTDGSKDSTASIIRIKKWNIKIYSCNKPSTLPHFLEIRLTDGGEVVSLTRRAPFTPEKDSWYSFLLEAESTPEPFSAAGRIRSIVKIQWPQRESNPRPSGL